MNSRRGIIRGALAAVVLASLVPAAVAVAHSGPDRRLGFGRHRHHHHDHYRARGWVVPSASSMTLTVRTFAGRLRSFVVSTATTYEYRHGGSATAADAAPYRIVHVRASAPTTSGGNPVATRVVIDLADVSGLVTSDAGGSLTVADGDGFTRQISTGSATCKQRRHITISCGSIASGSIVTAWGKVASDGTTLDASRIDVTPPRS